MQVSLAVISATLKDGFWKWLLSYLKAVVRQSNGQQTFSFFRTRYVIMHENAKRAITYRAEMWQSSDFINGKNTVLVLISVFLCYIYATQKIEGKGYHLIGNVAELCLILISWKFQVANITGFGDMHNNMSKKWLFLSVILSHF